jgi:TP901-1 family phage major tail protein
MTAQKGKDLLIKIADGASYTTVAGLRTRRLAFNAETVDVTHAESANRWRELLDGRVSSVPQYQAEVCSRMRRPTR